MKSHLCGDDPVGVGRYRDLGPEDAAVTHADPPSAVNSTTGWTPCLAAEPRDTTIWLSGVGRTHGRRSLLDPGAQIAQCLYEDAGERDEASGGRTAGVVVGVVVLHHLASRPVRPTAIAVLVAANRAGASRRKHPRYGGGTNTWDVDVVVRSSRPSSPRNISEGCRAQRTCPRRSAP